MGRGKAERKGEERNEEREEGEVGVLTLLNLQNSGTVECHRELYPHHVVHMAVTLFFPEKKK